MPMEVSESPSKSPAKSPAAGQSTEPKAAPPPFGSSASFSSTPLNNDTSQNPESKPSQPFGSSFFRPKHSTVEQQPRTPTSSLLHPSIYTRQKSEEQPSQPSGSVLESLSQPTKPEKDASENSNAPSSTQTFNTLTASNPAENNKSQEVKSATPFTFGMSSGAPQNDFLKTSPEKKAQETAPSNPFKALQSKDKVNTPSQPQEQKSIPPSLQPSQSTGSTLLNSFQPSRASGSQQTEPLALSNSTQPLGSGTAETSQTASPSRSNQFSQPSEAEKPVQASNHSSGHASSHFQTHKPSTEGSYKTAESQPMTTPDSAAHTPEEASEPSQQQKSDSFPLKQSAPAPAANPPIEHLETAKTSETLFDRNSKQSGNGSVNNLKQANGLGSGQAGRASEASNLFAQSLGKASVTTTKSDGNMISAYSQTEGRALSAIEPTAAPQTQVGDLSTTTTPPRQAPEPFVVKVKSHGASNVPPELDNDGFADFDKSYRLRSLNARFKKQIAELDPNNHDFEPIVRFYATQRAAIGHPIGGLYHRVKAGEKRKTEEPDRVEAAPNPTKRTKLDTAAASFGQNADRPVFNYSAITGESLAPQLVAGSPHKEAYQPAFNINSTSSASKTAQPAPATSNTSSVFKSMLSGPEQPSSGMQEDFPVSAPPTKSDFAMSVLKPTEQQTQPSATSTFHAMNSNTSMFLGGSPSKGNTASSPVANGAQNIPQLFQPKPTADSALEPPKFASAGGTDFMAAFAAQAKKNAAKMEAENRAKRKAEEFDSDEDDEAEYERRVAEDERAKRAKIEALSKAGCGFKPVLSSASSATSPAAEQEGESTRDASGEESTRSPADQVSVSEQGQNDEESDEDREDEETDEDDDIQTAMAKSHAKSKDHLGRSTDPKSLFNRITKPAAPSEDRGSKTEGSSPPSQANNSSVLSAPPGTGLFGSRPSTPNLDPAKSFGGSILGNLGSSAPTADNTWKPGSAIKFGLPTSTPAVNITPATPLSRTNGNTTQNSLSTFSATAPSASKLGADKNNHTLKASTSVFGAPASASQSTAASIVGSPKPFSSLFGDASKKTTANQSSAAQVGFSFGGPNKLGSPPLLAPSNVSSAITSRTTSPGLTDNDSAAESGTDDQANDPQSDYMASRPGEENEDVLFEVRSKALEYLSEKDLRAMGSKEDPGWKTRGLGPLRVLKNSETGQTRIVMRSEPGANVIINSPLIQDNKYDVNPSGKEGASLKTGIYMDGKLKNWVFKIKTITIANELVDCLKANEPQGKDAGET